MTPQEFLQKAERIISALPTRVANSPKVAENRLPQKEIITAKQARKMNIQTYLNDDDKLVLLKGDVFIKGNISNQWLDDLLKDMQWQGNVYGTIIDGNLMVDGDIIDDNYLILGVLGNVSCHYLFSKNGRIIIKSDLFATYGIYGEYNDGMLTIDGRLDTPYIFAYDHDMPRKSEVGEFIYIEAGEGTEKEYICIGQTEGSGIGWDWHYFENGDLMLKDSVFNNNELYEQLSVKKFFDLVKKGENPFLDFATFENNKAIWQEENSEVLEKQRQESQKKSEEWEKYQESKKHHESYIISQLYLHYYFEGNDNELFDYIVKEWEYAQQISDENERYTADSRVYNFYNIIGRMLDNWRIVLDGYLEDKTEVLRKIIIDAYVGVSNYCLKVSDMESMASLYHTLNEKVRKIEKNEPHFYHTLIKLSLALEKYEDIYPLLLNFEKQAEILSEYAEAVAEFFDNDGYQEWKKGQ